MPELVHKKPCNDCPYRRKSAAGWLGASEPEDFMEQTLGSQDAANAMPCHQTIDYEDEDWRETQYPDAPMCAGALQFLNNFMKLPHGLDLVAACEEVGTNPDVFANPTEFLRHHTGDEEGTWMTIGCRVGRIENDGSVEFKSMGEKVAPKGEAA